MGTRQRLVRMGYRVVALVATVLLVLGTFSCAKPTEPTQLMAEPTVEPNRLTSKLAEVSPPESIQLLKQVIDAYTPQVRILSPRPGEVIEDTSISLRVQVRGLPVFKNEAWGLGPHLHVFLDNEPYKAVYDLSQPLEFKDLSPGTHTLRVFASRPWHESFKNQGAFDQRTFHIYAPTPQDELSAEKPVLTYSRPQGTYGAEPIMLDFYLTNAPLHMTAQEDPNDDIRDWRIRCTVNGQSFVFDGWQAVYLKGFEPGRNWVQLELIDEAGNPIDNRFNNTVRVIDYEPGGEDTLSKLVRGELDVQAVAGIIDPTYEPPAKPEPEPEVEVAPPAAVEAIPESEAGAPEVEEVPAAEEMAPAEEEEIPEKEAAPSAATPETGAEERIPAEPQTPTPGVSPVAPEGGEPLVPPSPEGSDLVPEVTPEEMRQGSTAEEPKAEKAKRPAEAEGQGQPAEDSLVEPEAPATELKSPAKPEEAENIEPSEGGNTLQAPASLSTEVPGNDIEASGQAQPTNDKSLPSQVEGTNGAIQAPPKPSEELDQAAETSAGNKLLERYKRWQRRRQIESKPEQATPAPDSDQVDVYLSPPAGAKPEPAIPEDLAPSDGRMDRPDLVEPYLTKPYLTEPRLDLSLPDQKNSGQASDRDGEKTSSDQAASDFEPGQASQNPALTNPERPYI